MRLQLHVTGPAIDVDSYVKAIPLVLERSRGINWVTEGAVVDGELTDRLRVIDGVGGRPGATYQYRDTQQRDADTAEPVIFTVTRDDADAFEATGEIVPEAGVTVNGVVTLADPADPLSVRVVGRLHADELPGILGKDMDGELTAHLRDFDTAPEPQVELRFANRQASAHSLAHITRDGDRWQVTVDLDLRLRGLAALATPVLFLARRRITEVVTQQIEQALGETAAELTDGHDAAQTPETIADEAWASFVAEVRAPG